MDADYIKPAATAKLVRAALKKKFPGIKFSVRIAGGSLNVSWVDGPLASLVDEVVQSYSSTRFDCSIDMEYRVDNWLLPDGSAIVAEDRGTLGQKGCCQPAHNPQPEGAKLVRFFYGYSFCRREFSGALMRRVHDRLTAKGFPGADLEIDEVAATYKQRFLANPSRDLESEFFQALHRTHCAAR
ncbi:LPD29 domain-containing protein [Acidocella aminolytica]|uniref:Large polyvalent protein associated domain-containing protein n=1 Tax=Acidocella aminolytica 101 = DSM 11237 TaxID=1120923 RepID=A0A0D6PDG7_9PROT|nr:LPD29 domain-containing protein [Acidocella aminolytica]GAN79800.1 hypothetical protein Aam_030_033 [Acidocella aminolytica 101 = DSM 11237]GBQ34297.1 hypothetical protein AA11237_0706 [Acidocella aminolytica 101 = DSM 11237]SHF35385.1 hypothetical protein SAMN02746095_02933 [Acidocella aminolytica 101 = DSM 11237]